MSHGQLTQVVLQDLLSVRAHADMRTGTHTNLLLAGIVASGAFAAGLMTAGLSRIDDFALLFLVVPGLYVVACALYLDVSRSAYLAEDYIQEVVGKALPQLGSGTGQLAWYWERFASEGRQPVYMQVVGALKVGAAFLVPTAGALGAFVFYRSPNAWTWYEALLFSVDVAAIAILGLAGWMIHHTGRPVQVKLRAEVNDQ